MSRYYRGEKYFKCTVCRDALRVSVPLEWNDDDMAAGLEMLVRPYKWSLWHRMRAAWRLFWWGQETVHEIWLTRKKALALAEYILDGLGHEIDIEKCWKEVDALLPEGLPVSVKERIKLRSAGNKVVIKIMLGEVYKGISAGMTTEDICRMLGK